MRIYWIALCASLAGLGAFLAVLPYLEVLPRMIAGIAVTCILVILVIWRTEVVMRRWGGRAAALLLALVSLLGVAGVILLALRFGPGEALRWTTVLAGSMAACWAIQTWSRHKSDAFLKRAEARGWRMSEREQREARFDVMLLRGMGLKGKIIFFGVHLAVLISVDMAMYTLGLEGHLVTACLVVAGFLTIMVYYGLVLRKELVSKNLYQAELNTAREMQMGLLPSKGPGVDGLDIAGICLPATEVGGDYYGYFPHFGGGVGLGLAVADVSGKAMRAAVAAVMTSAMLRTEAGRGAGPSAVLTGVNRALSDTLEANAFVAALFARLEPAGGALTYSNAGQISPLLLRDGRTRFLPGASLPLGVDPGTEYGVSSEPMHSGDILFFFTDGVTEAMDERGGLFGFERVEQAARALPPTLPAQGMVETLLRAVFGFSGKAPQHDDLTLVVCKVI